jgi:uncharacterized membrane protein (DUF106 family)
VLLPTQKFEQEVFRFTMIFIPSFKTSHPCVVVLVAVAAVGVTVVMVAVVVTVTNKEYFQQP